MEAIIRDSEKKFKLPHFPGKQMIPFLTLSRKQDDECLNNQSRIHSLPFHWRSVHAAPIVPSLVHWFLLSQEQGRCVLSRSSGLGLGKVLRARQMTGFAGREIEKAGHVLKWVMTDIFSRSVDFLQWLRDDTACGYWVVVSQWAKFKYPWPESKENKRMDNDRIIFSF